MTEILMNIMSCSDFSKMTTSTVIFIRRSSLVPYYLSKVFIIVKKVDGVFVNIPDPFIEK